MPLYECSKCGHVDNTALGDYWWRYMHDGLPPLCSECSRGEWHGRFPKNTPEELGLKRGDDWKLRESD